MGNKQNTIGKDFTMMQLVKFVSAPVISKLVISVLSTLDDSLFISRYCGENALAAFSLTLPWWMLVDAFSMNLSCASVKCSMLMGEKKNEEACDSFTTMAVVSVLVGFVFSILLTLFRNPICDLLGQTDLTRPIILEYFSVSRFYTPLVFLTLMFNRFYVLAGKPKMSVISTGLMTFCNLFCDWLFIVKLNTGIVGAAYGNLAGNALCSLLGLVFFSNKNQEIHFGKFIKHPFPLIKEVVRLGRSSSLTSISLSVNGFITNRVLLAVGNELIVSANSIVNNVAFMFLNAVFGCLDSTSPMVSYAFGEKNKVKLSRNIKQIFKVILGLAIIISIIYKLATPLVLELYLANNPNELLRSMTKYGMSVMPFVFPFFAINVYTQEMANAVGNSKLSSMLSLLENVIFSNIFTICLPLLFNEKGVWFTFLTCEIVTFIFTLYAIEKNKNVYGYGKDNVASAIENVL